MDEKTVHKLAVEDEDLKPLWASMSGTIWKKEYCFMYETPYPAGRPRLVSHDGL